MFSACPMCRLPVTLGGRHHHDEGILGGTRVAGERTCVLPGLVRCVIPRWPARTPGRSVVLAWLGRFVGTGALRPGCKFGPEQVADRRVEILAEPRPKSARPPGGARTHRAGCPRGPRGQRTPGPPGGGPARSRSARIASRVASILSCDGSVTNGSETQLLGRSSDRWRGAARRRQPAGRAALRRGGLSATSSSWLAFNTSRVVRLPTLGLAADSHRRQCGSRAPTIRAP